MPEKPSESSQPIDVRTIHQLVRMMQRYDLTAIDVNEGSTKIRLRRRGPELAQYPSAPQVPPGFALAAPHAPAPAPAPAAPEPAPKPAPAGVVIESPMVGTFYSASGPDAPPFVSVGSTVRPDATVCVIEAMKVFTDIPAQVSGQVTEVLVKNGQPVEFGQPLFRVIPAS